MKFNYERTVCDNWKIDIFFSLVESFACYKNGMCSAFLQIRR